jgi:hypothetical protein
MGPTMSLRRAPALVTMLAVLAVLAPAARAARLQPLVDVAPVGDPGPGSTRLLDRAMRPSRLAARAAAVRARVVATPDGQSVRVVLSRAYTANARLVQSYVSFLASLPHGRELGLLKIIIATPAEVARACGAADSVACYGRDTMIVPGEQVAGSTGLTTSYAIAHEYGHHVAAHRSNAPFRAIDTGPKRWSSYERVCVRTLDGRLFPGDEGTLYRLNPGEAWADTYAHLVYPTQPWAFTPLLRPDATALATARFDVLAPWTRPITRTFAGSFGFAGARTRRFALPLTLDGSFVARLAGPRGTNFDVALVSRGRRIGRTRARGSADRLRFRALCRETLTERATLVVTRRWGAGAFSVAVRYAG